VAHLLCCRLERLLSVYWQRKLASHECQTPYRLSDHPSRVIPGCSVVEKAKISVRKCSIRIVIEEAEYDLIVVTRQGSIFRAGIVAY